jgi:hypothetical protein
MNNTTAADRIDAQLAQQTADHLELAALFDRQAHAATPVGAADLFRRSEDQLRQARAVRAERRELARIRHNAEVRYIETRGALPYQVGA